MNKSVLEEKLERVNRLIERIKNGSITSSERVWMLDTIEWLYRWRHISAKEYLRLSDIAYNAYVERGLIKDDR